MSKLSKFDRDSLVNRLFELRNGQSQSIIQDKLNYNQGLYAGLMMAGAIEVEEFCRLMDLALNVWTCRFHELCKQVDAVA